MDRLFKYRQKNVQDIAAEHGVVRIWDAAGDFDRKGIAKAFEPLLRAGFVYPYVALMPDHHPGEGSMVGSVIPTRHEILLDVVGGDLGCGVAAAALPVEASALVSALPKVRRELEAAIPTGTSINTVVTKRIEDHPLWDHELHSGLLSSRVQRKLIRQFASLGGGNHFLELQRDQTGRAWVMLHSGSRYLGVLIRDHYVATGQNSSEVDQRIYRRVPYLPAGSGLAEAYLSDLEYAVRFARASRREMMLRALEVIARCVDVHFDAVGGDLADGIVDVSHNYVKQEDHFGQKLYVHRKGAVRAEEGETVLIPGSMGTASFVAEGRGNAYAFCSCSHGAGRRMSRGAAIRSISDRDFEASVEGVDVGVDTRLKDESPIAYKDIGSVMRGQKDLVAIRNELHPILSIKGIN